MNPYVYVANNPLNLIDPTGMACGDLFRDPLIPDNPGGYDFTECCQGHDDCYGGFCGEFKTKAQCDEGLYDCAIKQCNKIRGGQQCYLMAAIYYKAVKERGDDAFENARQKNQCHRCHPW